MDAQRFDRIAVRRDSRESFDVWLEVSTRLVELILQAEA